LFLAIKVGAALLGLLLGAGSGFTIYGFTAQGGYVLAGCAGAGFYLPELVLWFLKSKRMERIFLAMPDALDLLVVCVEAGLGLDAAMRRVAEELGDSANARDVCTEFNLCNMQLQMGRARREVLHDLGVRSGVDDMRALAAILIQADKFGSSIAQALRVQSDSMRIKRSQLAEGAAQKTAVKMIFPLVLFIFPGIFVVLVGPAAIQMMRNLITQ
jgi:tight adherence protein C